MRHSDSKLTERIYTDKRMLATWSATEKLPSYTGALSQGVSRNLGASGLGASSAVMASVGAHDENMAVNIGESHLVALDVTSGQSGENGGSDGARTRNLCRDRAAPRSKQQFVLQLVPPPTLTRCYHPLAQALCH